MNQRTSMNLYLALEFGLAEATEAQRRASDAWPFTLDEVGSLEAGGVTHTIFRFEDGDDAYFAFTGPTMNFVPTGGLDLDGLQQLWAGSAWLYDHDVVELSEARPGEADVPSSKDRFAALAALLAEVAPEATLRVGLFLRKTQRYLGLADLDDERSLVFGTDFEPVEVREPGLTPHRRLAYALGGLAVVSGGA
ncbi:MAG: hypothetical protein AAGA54_26990 [Myxococcota bacterium]